MSKEEEILEYFNVELVKKQKKGLNWYIYLTETANNYDVICSTEDPERVSVDSDVFIDKESEQDLLEELLEDSFKDAILLYSNPWYGGEKMKIYIYDIKASWVKRAIMALEEDIHDLERKEEEDERKMEEYIYG
jgi:hypothetical protein